MRKYFGYLRKNGFEIEGERVKIKEALANFPREIKLYGRDGRYIDLSREVCNFSTGGGR